MDRLSELLGEVLRRARRDRGLTLHDVLRKSRGRFKPSTVGGYERGERIISVKRLCELAALYGIPADRLIADLLELLNPRGRRPLVLEPGRLQRIDEDVRPWITEFIKKITSVRGDDRAKVVSLRSGDLEALSAEAGVAPSDLMERLTPALRK